MKLRIIYMGLIAGSLVWAGCNPNAKEKTASKTEQSLEVRDLASHSRKEEKMPEGPLPVFKFEEEEYDFGTIKQGEVVTHVFRFTNVGDAPLIIQDASASCGCTVPNWPEEPIPAGETANIEVKFNSKGKSGSQNKTVTITANTYPKQKKIKIKGQIVAS